MYFTNGGTFPEFLKKIKYKSQPWVPCSNGHVDKGLFIVKYFVTFSFRLYLIP